MERSFTLWIFIRSLTHSFYTQFCYLYFLFPIFHHILIKGAGRGGRLDDPGKFKIELSAVPDRGGCQLPDQKIFFLDKVIGF